MGARRARRRGGGRPVLLVLAAVVVTTALVGITLAVRNPPDSLPAAAEPKPAPGSYDQVDLSALPIEREDFCDRVPETAVEEALSGPAVSTERYGSGDRATLAPGVTDIAHEYSCGYVGTDGTQARVWVFASPARTGEAKVWVRRARAAQGCEPAAGPAFGTPSAATTCTTDDPASRVVTLRGLFGDAWLSCQVSVPGTPPARVVARRADSFCVEVVTTLGARP